MKRHILISALGLLLLLPGLAFSDVDLKRLDADTECNMYLDEPKGGVVKDEADLIDLYVELLGRDEGIERAARVRQYIDFKKEALIYIIGEKSQPGYKVEIVDDEIALANGTLKIVVDITRPKPRVEEQSKRRSLVHGKNPFYIYKVELGNLGIRSLSKVIFCELNDACDERHSFSVWKTE